jgi:hypothetical protein
MAAWIRYSRRRFAYAGRIGRAPFTAWTATPEGSAAIGAVAARIRFAMLGRKRAAQRRVWRQLSAAARNQAVVTAIQAEVQRFPARLGSLANSPGLPCDMVQLRRLVVVPRVLVNGDAYEALRRQLGMRTAFVSIEGGEALRQFFIEKLIDDLEAAINRLGPSPQAPLATGSAWMSVGVNSTFDWRVSLMNEPAWDGHHYLLEVTREPLTRALRKAVAASVARMEQALPTLSRLERNDLLRRARFVA